METVGVEKRAVEHRFGYLEADEIVVRLRRVIVFRHLHHIETELSFQMRGRVLCIGDLRAILGLQFRVHDGHRKIHRDGMAVIIAGIVRQGAEREGVLIEVLRLVNQGVDEVAAADIMHEVTKWFAAERIIAHVLDDAAAIGKSVSFT